MTNLDYLYSSQKDRYIYNSIFKREDLIVQNFLNGYLLPVQKSNKYLFGKGGVADSNHKFLKESAIISRGAKLSNNKEDLEIYLGEGYLFEEKDVKIHIDEKIVYLGYIMNHWGHFLIDFSTRLWYVLENRENVKFAFVIEEDGKCELHDNILRFLELIGLNNNNCLFINKLAKCKEIVIPECSYITNLYWSNEYLNVFNYIKQHINRKTFQISSKKIYFSRRKFRKANNSEIGENMLENFFSKNGFEIISPEKYTLDEQICMITNSECVAAISGTIPHNMLFANEGQEIVIINKTYSINTMQFDINAIKKLRCTYIDAWVAVFPVSMGKGPFIYVCNRCLQDYIRNNNLNYPDDKYCSQYYLKKIISSYMKLWRATNLQVSIEYQTDKNSVYYYDPQIMSDFVKVYYWILNPERKYEKIVFQMKKIIKFIIMCLKR